MLELIILAPLLGGLLSFALSRYAGMRAAELAAVAGAGLALLFAGIAVGGFVASGVPVSDAGGILYMDSLSAFFTFLTALVALAAFVYSLGYIRREVEHGVVPEHRVGIYYALLSLFLTVMLFATLAANLIMVWAAIEATTLASTFLISFYNKRESVEAAWKFFLINSVGITLALIGILVLGVAMDNAGQVTDFNLPLALSSASSMDPLMLKIAFALVLVGYGTKMGLVPMHTWLPDAHSQAPTPVSAVLSGVLLNIALYGILRVYQVMLGTAETEAFASSLFIFFGAVTLALAALRLRHQSNLKRMLAYSSIENMGLVALAIGVGGPIGMFAALFHVAAHSLAKPLAFMVGGTVALAYDTKEMDRIRGVGQVMPGFGLLLVIVLLGVAGSLPFGTFISEILLIGASLSAGNMLAAGLVVLFTSIAFATMLHKGVGMAYGEKPEGIHRYAPGYWMTLAIALLLGLSLYLAFGAPQVAVSLMESSAQALLRGA